MKKTLITSLMFLVSLFVCMPAFAQASNVDYETANSHKAKGIDCVNCHGVKTPTAALEKERSTALCSGCHGSLADLAKTTATVNPNPHDTHLGKMDCYECHNIHKTSANMCASCHTFPMRVP